MRMRTQRGLWPGCYSRGDRDLLFEFFTHAQHECVKKVSEFIHENFSFHTDPRSDSTIFSTLRGLSSSNSRALFTFSGSLNEATRSTMMFAISLRRTSSMLLLFLVKTSLYRKEGIIAFLMVDNAIDMYTRDMRASRAPVQKYGDFGILIFMRSGFLVLLIGALVFGGGYWYVAVQRVCPVPREYYIGAVDARFNITSEEVRLAAEEAEKLWEGRVGIDLFTYEEGGDLSIQFVFDERQEKVNEEGRLREVLESKENVSESVKVQYESLLQKYNTLKYSYEKSVSAYEQKLSAYNTEVREWNDRGGAPQDVFDRLATTETSLAQEETKLNALARELNALARSMNTLSAQGNSIIEDYNEVVEEYNERAGGGEEFTQGEYQDSKITIFEYERHDELVLVLAHEFGHALGFEHVDTENAIMYRLMEEQTLATGVTVADVSEFTRRCADGTLKGRLSVLLRETMQQVF